MDADIFMHFKLKKSQLVVTFFAILCSASWFQLIERGGEVLSNP